MKRRLNAALGLVFTLMLIVASCFAAGARDPERLSGRMLLWHTWTGPQAEALNAVVTSFAELNPDVTVRQHAFASLEEMQQQYLNSVSAGLGPDLILAPSSWLRELPANPPLDPVNGEVSQAVLDRTMPAALAAMRLNDQQYGLPLALDVQALYYNRTRVEAPPPTLDDLLVQTAQEQVALIPTNFYDAFWGIQAFGGQLFDENGRTILDRGGFANWLAWLKDAREVPGMILDSNRAALRDRFLAGDAAYYVGYARELSTIQEALGVDAVGVATLPSGPVSNAGPFLGADGFFFSPASSDNQRRLALALSQFITNAEQSGYLMRTIQMVPANGRVRVNPRLNPIVASFASQARSSIPVPDRPDMETVFALGNDAFNQALEGDRMPAEAAFAAANAINEATGFPPATELATACTGLGTIRLAHMWKGRSASALEELIRRYDERCPLVIVDTEVLDPDALQPRLTGERLAGRRPTFVLGDRSWLGPLVQESLLLNIGPRVDGAALQRFWPVSLDAMRAGGSLYGVPVALTVDALYYNLSLVSAPAAILDELRAQASQGIPITLDRRFTKAFWGIGAFGGRLFDEEYRVVLDQGGMAEWLAWLVESRDAYGIHLTTDGDALREAFLAGETAYYIGGPGELEDLQAALGADNVGVALLPAGPEGNSRPLINATGFLFRATAAETTAALAQDFAIFVTEADSQTHLMQAAGLLPANATVDLNGHPTLGLFAEQLQAGFLPPNHPYWQTVLELGDEVYDAVLEQGQDPSTAVAELTQRINDIHGIAPAPTPTMTVAPTVPISASTPITTSGAVTATQTPTATTSPVAPDGP